MKHQFPGATMKVLLPMHGLCRWNGGIDFARLLVTALSSVEHAPDLAFALPETPARSRWRVVQTLGVLAGRQRDAGEALMRSAATVARDFPILRVPDSADGIARAARESGADIVFPTMVPLPPGSPPAVGYIFDFQHRHLPSNFTWIARRRRDLRFRRLVRGTSAIAVNSRHTRADAVHFLHADPARVLALPYAPYVLPEWLDLDIDATRQRYGLTAPYVIVCNQTWVHKDHPTALKAYALACADLPLGTRLVLTGEMADHRHRGYAARLRAMADDLGITDRVDWLGLIPKPDQIALLRGALMVWQPTLFEGGPGGGSVYEATGLGVPAAVSDIDINRELDRGNIRLFSAGRAESLAAEAIELAREPSPRRDDASLQAASRESLQRLGTAIVAFLEKHAGRSAGG